MTYLIKALSSSPIMGVVLALLTGTSFASCGTAFCSVNTHWDTQGLSNSDGLSLDIRYSLAKADQWRSGSSRITPDAPTGSDAELEDKRTINRLLNIDADYAINSSWNVGVGVPLVMRDHSHTFDSSVSGPFEQRGKFTETGDIRVVGKYKFDMGSLSSGGGIRFGLKLATGAIGKVMTPPDPANPGTPYKLDRSSQPGSGSTDVILGLYRYGSFAGSDWGWFANGQAQGAVAVRDAYRPGRQLNLDVGTSYAFSHELTGLLQLNMQHRSRDTGLNANVASGGHATNLSPGLVYALTPKTQVYAFLQIPVRQYVNADPADPASGQLTAAGSLALGVSQRF